MTTLFNLPSSILSTIYAMDSTYRDKFRQEIHKEIFTKCIDIFCKKFINKDRPVIVSDEINFQKVDILLKFVFDGNGIFYEITITIIENNANELFKCLYNMIINNEIHLKGHIYRITQYGYTWEFIYTHTPSYSFCSLYSRGYN